MSDTTDDTKIPERGKVQAEEAAEVPRVPSDVDEPDMVEAATAIIVGGPDVARGSVRYLGDGTGRVAVYDKRTKTGALVAVLTERQYIEALEGAAKLVVLGSDGLDDQGRVHPLVRSADDAARARAQAMVDRMERRLADARSALAEIG